MRIEEPLRHFLSERKVCSPRRAYSFLEKNLVIVNGIRITDWNYALDPERDEVLVNGTGIPNPRYTYLMMNKPAGYVCSTVSDRSPTVFSLLDERYGSLFTVGRLDKDSEGLLLLTDNGSFSHYITSPEASVSKTYEVELEFGVSPWEQMEYTEKFREGLYLPEEKKGKAFLCKSAVLEWKNSFFCTVTVEEGKFRQVRRMFSVMENNVVRLIRKKIGPWELDSALGPGEYREFDPYL